MGKIQISQVAQKIINIYNDCILDNNNKNKNKDTTMTTLMNMLLITVKKPYGCGDKGPPEPLSPAAAVR